LVSYVFRCFPELKECSASVHWGSWTWSWSSSCAKIRYVLLSLITHYYAKRSTRWRQLGVVICCCCRW